MRRLWRSLRVRLALFGFLAGYVPVLLLFGVVLATETDVTQEGGATATAEERHTTSHRSDAALWTVLALGPAAAGLAWWWAGRATAPIDRVRMVAAHVQGADLGRRTALRRGPTEVVALAASFDDMLERLERAAELQRRLIEETSHELRMPLAVLVTNAEVLLTHPRPTVEVYRQGLERSRTAAVRLQQVMGELLVDARGRARTLDRQAVCLAAVARSVAAQAEVAAVAKGMRLSVTGAPAAVCPVDEATVRRAVHNLLDNAIRYAPAGTAVTVDVQVGAAEVAVVVTDEGPGIPADDQARVFQRFWRGPSGAHGTGLGWAIARQVALAHGGTLTLASPGPTGVGCAFRFSVAR
ncbi:HAMP domain-containing sensor histidine kinase [Streptomyces sp. HSW2009]|uniref:HAMP domain-containing sensor histidine kinase n=1 Tax=Streptomyces sp. HSW2009 TaxID=3142890 RepID=UPI0032F00AB8